MQQAKSVVKVTSFRILTKGSTGKTVHLKRRSWGSNLTHTYDKFRKRRIYFDTNLKNNPADSDLLSALRYARWTKCQHLKSPS